MYATGDELSSTMFPRLVGSWRKIGSIASGPVLVSSGLTGNAAQQPRRSRRWTVTIDF